MSGSGSDVVLISVGRKPNTSGLNLEKIGIEGRLESEQVGQGLQDHLIAPVIFQVRSGRFSSHASVQDIARWQTMGTGPLASNLAECGGLFLQESIQIHVTPTHYLSYPKLTDCAFMTLGVNANHCVHLYSTIYCEIGKSSFWFEISYPCGRQNETVLCVRWFPLSRSRASVPQAICQGYQAYFVHFLNLKINDFNHA